MASFSLFLTQAPLASSSHYLALDFAYTLLKQGHQLNNVFFYQDAVYVGLAGQVAPQGQKPLAQEWQQLVQGTNIPLQLCIATAVRRGILDRSEQQRYQQPSVTLCDGFQLVGLGEMAQSYRESDRVIQF